MSSFLPLFWYSLVNQVERSEMWEWGQGANLDRRNNIEKVQWRVPWPEFTMQWVVHEKRFRWLLCR
jgi:hypothetical protein